MAQVLAYHFQGPRLQTLMLLCLRQGTVLIPVDDDNATLDEVLQKKAKKPVEKQDGFSEEMLVLCHFSEAQLDMFLHGMKASGLRVPLKAVYTVHNGGWTGCQLYRELRSEDAQMRERSV